MCKRKTAFKLRAELNQQVPVQYILYIYFEFNSWEDWLVANIGCKVMNYNPLYIDFKN